MSPVAYEWFEAAHVFAVILWISGLFACFRLLRAHAAGAGKPAADTARSTALVMDIGAAIAIAAGVVMLLGVEPSPLREGWMHPKLALVVIGLFAFHGVCRAKIKKARTEGEGSVHPAAEAVLLALAALIAILAVAKPM